MSDRARSSDHASPLQTLDRGLQVLLSYSERRKDWGVMELAEEFGLSKSSAHRLLAGLATKGFLHSDPYTRRYSLGPAVWHMASLWERSGGLARLGQQCVLELAEVTGRTACFCVPVGMHVRCIAAVDGPCGPVHQNTLVGELYPAHVSATSRAYFAHLSPADRRVMLYSRPLARYSDQTQVDTDELERLFTETIRSGFALSEGEYDGTTRALAVPVLLGSRPVGSLSVVEHKVDDNTAAILDHLSQLEEAAGRLAAVLGNRHVTQRPRTSAG